MAEAVWGEVVLIKKSLCIDQWYTKSFLRTYFTFPSAYFYIIEVYFIIFGIIKLSLWKGWFSITSSFIKPLINLLRESSEKNWSDQKYQK